MSIFKKPKVPKGIALNLKEQQALAEKQKGFLSTLEARAAGKAPSLSEQALKAAQERNLKQQLALAKSNKSPNAGLSARNLARSAAETGAQTAQQGALMKTQEQNQNIAAVGSELANQRSQNLAMEQGRSQALTQQAQANATASQVGLGGFQALAGGVGAALGSDEDMKEDIKKESKEGSESKSKSKEKNPNKLKDFLDKLQAYSYDYKEPNKPGRSKGKQLGIMAQDLEKSEIGKEMVEETSEGKMVNYAKGYSKVLAAAADMNKRLSELEKQFKPKKSKKD